MLKNHKVGQHLSCRNPYKCKHLQVLVSNEPPKNELVTLSQEFFRFYFANETGRYCIIT